MAEKPFSLKDYDFVRHRVTTDSAYATRTQRSVSAGSNGSTPIHTVPRPIQETEINAGVGRMHIQDYPNSSNSLSTTNVTVATSVSSDDIVNTGTESVQLESSHAAETEQFVVTTSAVQPTACLGGADQFLTDKDGRRQQLRSTKHDLEELKYKSDKINELTRKLEAAKNELEKERNSNISNKERINELERGISSLKEQIKQYQLEQRNSDDMIDGHPATFGAMFIKVSTEGAQKGFKENDVLTCSTIQELGSGSTGFVMEVKFPKQSQNFAAKYYYSRQLKFDEGYRYFEYEKKCLKVCKHENVITYYGYCETGRPPKGVSKESLIMELMQTTFAAYFVDLSKENVPSQTYLLKICNVLFQVAKGLKHLHCLVEPTAEATGVKKIFHRDLTANNILLSGIETNCPVAKIADFGFSRPVSADSSLTRLGNTAYRAPEIYLGTNYDEKVDIFSFGHLMLVSALAISSSNYKQYEGNFKKTTTEIEKREKMFTELRQRFERISVLDKYIELAEDCLQDSPMKRPNAEALIEKMSRIFDCLKSD